MAMIRNPWNPCGCGSASVAMLVAIPFVLASPGCRHAVDDGRANHPLAGTGPTIDDPRPPLPPSEPRVVTLQGDIRVDVRASEVSFPGVVSLEQGWLEVAVCRQGTREHEAVVATGVVPSLVHAGLLLAGFEPGAPGGYHPNGSGFGATGVPVGIELEFEAAAEDGWRSRIELSEAIVDVRAPEDSPNLAWVFAGSGMFPNPPSMGEGEYYAADYGGSIVGLSTFGDEVLAAVETRSPDSGVDDAVWKIREGILPPEGTPVRVVIRRTGP